MLRVYSLDCKPVCPSVKIIIEGVLIRFDRRENVEEWGGGESSYVSIDVCNYVLTSKTGCTTQTHSKRQGGTPGLHALTVCSSSTRPHGDGAFLRQERLPMAKAGGSARAGRLDALSIFQAG